jgi:hypothetical protein
MWPGRRRILLAWRHAASSTTPACCSRTIGAGYARSIFTDASKAYSFPAVPGLFRQYIGPADFVETATRSACRATPSRRSTSGSPISSRSAAKASSYRASRSGGIPTGWCGPWTFGQPDVVRLQSGVVLCWRSQGQSSDVTKSLFACLGCHLLPRRSAPSGTDRLWLERGNWRLEHTDVAELGWTHRGRRLGLLRIQPCPTVCSKELIQLKSGRVHSAIVGHVDRLT